MFYKVIKDNKVIDVLDRLVYLKYQEKHNRMQFCDEEDAQAIFSSDMKHIWHEESLYNLPVDGYDTVRIESIDKYEYNQLKILNGKTPEEIIDLFVLSLNLTTMFPSLFSFLPVPCSRSVTNASHSLKTFTFNNDLVLLH